MRVTGIYPPTVPAFDLWLALFCAVTECCTSFLIFTPAITETFSQNFLILGLVITIITSQLTVSSAFEWTMKTVIASWYGAGFGCAIVAFATAVNHNHYNPYIGVAVSIPFAIFVCLAEQANVTHCKLSAVYRGDKALLLIMIVVVFGGDVPYWAALTACIAYTTGTTITLLGTLILWCLHLLPRPGPPPMAWLGLCMSEYFEEISSVAPVGEIQQEELDQKWKRLDRAAAAAAETPDSHLRGIIFSMVSSLSTLAHAIKHASFSEAAVKQLWEPVDHSLNVIRVEAVCRLRPSPDTRVAKLDLYSLAISLRKKSTDALAAHTIWIESGDMRPISESELARFDFCTREIANYVELVADFLFRVNNPPSSMKTAWAHFKSSVKKWIKAPLFKRLNPPTPWLVRLAYPIRSGVGACVADSVELVQDAEPASRIRKSLDERVISAGDELLEIRGERWSQVTDATVETKLFSCLRGLLRSDERHVNAAHIIACQPLLDRLNRRTMVVVTAAGSFHPSSEESRGRFDEILGGLTPFISDMRTAGQELARVTNNHGSHRGLWDARSRKFDEALMSLTRVESKMRTAIPASRKRRARSDVDEAKEEDLSDVYAILRALSLFMEAWRDVEHMMYFGYVKDSVNPFDVSSLGRSREMRRMPTLGVARLRAYSSVSEAESTRDDHTATPTRSERRSS
ncbi:Aluminum-activated malate transporter 1 [Perkinsus olseni]|uniref:Aluminum-activated malate transporter 1 n=1 Tax=Perkinsus olseni TaxID=32597 RepID=A0A7J6ME11_PEROL|nr:Aluminum-activated malate transporter 1 [Perkinsus olseni]